MCKEDGKEGRGRDPATELEILRRMGLNDGGWSAFANLVALIAGNRARKIGLLAKEDVQDFCGDCVLRAYRIADRFVEGNSVGLWLAIICKHVAGERLRRIRRDVLASSGSEGALLVSEESREFNDNPLDRLLRHEELHRLDQRLGRVDPVVRRLVELRVFAGLSWALIAETTSLTAEGAKARFHRFIAQLRQEFGVDDQNG